MFQLAQWFRRSYPALLVGLGLAIGPRVIAQIPPPPPSFDAPAPSQTSPNQTAYPACQPPSVNEYLLLVLSQTPDSQDQVRRALPANTTTTVCTYLNDVVMRVGGFPSVDSANAWAKYLKESAGLTAVVARPAETTTAVTPTPQPQSSPASVATASPQTGATPKPTRPTPAASRDRLAYNPRPLGSGYAVLVDFFSRPELVGQIHQLLGKEIGLVAYRQRPYLLAIYTRDQNQANATLRALADRGFWAMVVDSRRTTLLRQAIDIPRVTSKQ